MTKHTRHHGNPNQIGRDPDIAPGWVSFTDADAEHATGFQAWITRRQGWLFYPLMLLLGLDLHQASIRRLFRPGKLDGRAAELAAEQRGVAVPVHADWLLLVELAGESGQTARLAGLLEDIPLAGEPAVGVDVAARQRLWELRDGLSDAMGAFGPPLKFDVSLPLSSIAPFAAEAAALTGRQAPGAVAMLFGHVGEGNLHLNVLRCGTDREPSVYAGMMELIAVHGGNVSSEHGVGSRKRPYLPMSRQAADIAAMRTIKAAFDPTGYLNPAVLFD